MALVHLCGKLKQDTDNNAVHSKIRTMGAMIIVANVYDLVFLQPGLQVIMS